MTAKVPTKKVTIEAKVIRKDGTVQDLGVIAGKRTLRQKFQAWRLRRKMLRDEARRKRNG